MTPGPEKRDSITTPEPAHPESSQFPDFSENRSFRFITQVQTTFWEFQLSLAGNLIVATQEDPSEDDFLV
jgi:hypothetical protein